MFFASHCVVFSAHIRQNLQEELMKCVERGHALFYIGKFPRHRMIGSGNTIPCNLRQTKPMMLLKRGAVIDTDFKTPLSKQP
jgi:hypothetical protein